MLFDTGISLNFLLFTLQQALWFKVQKHAIQMKCSGWVRKIFCVLLGVTRRVKKVQKQLLNFLTVKPVYGSNATALKMSIIDVAHSECQSLLRIGDWTYYFKIAYFYSFTAKP